MSKIRLILGCCLLLVLFSSCRPRNVLTRKEMTDVLYDIHLTESAVDGIIQPIPESWLQGMDAEYFQEMAYYSVLRNHRIDQETFYASVAWYSKHLNLFEKVYIDVQDRLDRFRTAIEEGDFEHLRNLTRFGVDTAKIRSIYRYGYYRKDTIPVTNVYLVGKTVPSSSEWYAKQWLYRPVKDTVTFEMFPYLSIHSVFNTSNPDSLKMMADTLIQQNNNAPSFLNQNLSKEVLLPGGHRSPIRHTREIPKDEQIRNRFRPRVREQKVLKRMEEQRQRREEVEPSKKK
jgi:hypothetical protein